jgi:hypothetical protein
VPVLVLVLHINRQCVSHSARISLAVQLLRPADPHHLFHNLPCYVVPLVLKSLGFSRMVVPAHQSSP